MFRFLNPVQVQGWFQKFPGRNFRLNCREDLVAAQGFSRPESPKGFQ